MIIHYVFADGTKDTVEVDEEIGMVILESRRLESNYDRKERYHNYSLDSTEFEGAEYVDEHEPLADLIAAQDRKKLNEALMQLTDTQRKRLLQSANGLTTREIAIREGINHATIVRSIEKAQKNLKKFL